MNTLQNPVLKPIVDSNQWNRLPKSCPGFFQGNSQSKMDDDSG